MRVALPRIERHDSMLDGSLIHENRYSEYESPDGLSSRHMATEPRAFSNIRIEEEEPWPRLLTLAP